MLSENLYIKTVEIIPSIENCNDIINSSNRINYRLDDERELTTEYEKLTLKQLIFIYHLYTKQTLTSKKKNIVIKKIIEFENDIENIDIVNKRKTLWYYYNKLKIDKNFGKYIIDI
jgi:hypothetical protein